MCVRIDRGQENTVHVAKWLAAHPLVTKVIAGFGWGLSAPARFGLGCARITQRHPVVTSRPTAGPLCGRAHA